MNRRASLLACCLTATCLATSAHAASALTPAQADTAAGARDFELQAAADSVTQFHGALLASMRANVEFEQRLAIVQPAVQAFLDVPAIARVCLGRSWRALAETQQTEFVQLLASVISATYARRFARDSGQTFNTISSARARGGVVVKTQLLRTAGDPVQLDYYFRRGGAFNIVANGVSDLSLRRADYNAILKDRGFAALMDHLRLQRNQAGEKS